MIKSLLKDSKPTDTNSGNEKVESLAAEIGRASCRERV